MRAKAITSRAPVSSLFAGVMLAATVIASPANAVLTFTDRTAWEAALGTPVTTDTFSNVIGPATVIVFDTGVTSTLIGTGTNRVQSTGVFVGQINPPGGSFGKLLWEFPDEIKGFAFDFISINNTNNLVGEFDGVGTQTINIDAVTGETSGFIGVIGDSGFDSFEFVSSGLVDTFLVDNLSFGGASEIPEPLGLALFASGLAGLGVAGWRRRRFANALQNPVSDS